MKFIFVLILSVLFVITAYAQQDSNLIHKSESKNIPKTNEEPDNALGLIPKINPMALPGLNQNLSIYEISLEKEFLKHESFQVSYVYIYSKKISTQAGSYQSSINPEFRYYFNKKLSHSSFFVGTGMIDIISSPPYVISYENKFAAGINFGGRLIYHRVVFDFCLAYNYNFPIFSGTFFSSEFGIGYRF
jgi:hypothetical protein